MTAEELMRAGAAARQLLESEDFKLGMEAVRGRALQQWASTTPAQSKEREECYYLFLATAQLENHFRALADSGRFEEHKQQEVTNG